ncbi:MAG: hypothetical protein HFG58_12440 [Lachnospiraceae bacterium]|jgi:hypothetical protein|nr:hypothetical protein [Lachnospiraceae bacterium]
MGIRGIGSFLLVLSISAAFAAGCKGQENKTGEQETVKKYEQAKSPEDIKEQALDYLDGLYEDTFTVQSATAISWAENYETITVASERFSGRTFQVRRIHGDKDIIFKDNYFTLTMVADAEKYVKELTEEASLNADVAVEFTEGERPGELAADAVFGDYVRMGGSPFCYLTLTTMKEPQKEERLAFLELLAGEKFQCNVVFRYGTSSWRYGVDSDYDIRDYN